MYPSPKFTREDVEVMRKRLTVDHLVDRTAIFYPGISLRDAQVVTLRFEQYWKTWVEKELEKIFEFVLKATSIEPIEGGVLIHGEGYKRYIMNSWHDDLDVNTLS